MKTAIAIIVGFVLGPGVTLAQTAPKDCTAGDGLYACSFKDQDGGLYSGTLSYLLNEHASSFNATIGGAKSFFVLGDSCDCGVKGGIGNTKPLKDTKEVQCVGSGSGSEGSFMALLAGKVAGNPANPSSQKTRGQLHFYPIGNNTAPQTSGWLFDCRGSM